MIICNSLNDPKVVSLLQSGAVAVIPTDTVYGLVARADDYEAVARLYALKHRTKGKPGTVIAASIQQLIELGIDGSTLAHVAHLWPNPLSIVIQTAPHLDYLNMGLLDLAVRIPEDQSILKLLRRTGPLLTSSANEPGKPPATNLAEAQQFFGDSVDLYVDGGDLSGRLPSTVAVLLGDKLSVVRPGAVTINSKGEIVGDL
jgi:L-threonylcarbamoyladenylate synthase